jgi:hypothetical protein
MELPNDWIALLTLVFILGAKHGLDADHLATIDGLTRHTTCASPQPRSLVRLAVLPRPRRHCPADRLGGRTGDGRMAGTGMDGRPRHLDFDRLPDPARRPQPARRADRANRRNGGDGGHQGRPPAPPAGDVASAGDRRRGRAVRPVLRHHEPGRAVCGHRHAAWWGGPHPGARGWLSPSACCWPTAPTASGSPACCAAPTTARASPRASWA